MIRISGYCGRCQEWQVSAPDQELGNCSTCKAPTTWWASIRALEAHNRRMAAVECWHCGHRQDAHDLAAEECEACGPCAFAFPPDTEEALWGPPYSAERHATITGAV